MNGLDDVGAEHSAYLRPICLDGVHLDVKTSGIYTTPLIEFLAHNSPLPLKSPHLNPGRLQCSDSREIVWREAPIDNRRLTSLLSGGDECLYTGRLKYLDKGQFFNATFPAKQLIEIELEESFLLLKLPAVRGLPCCRNTANEDHCGHTSVRAVLEDEGHSVRCLGHGLADCLSFLYRLSVFVCNLVSVASFCRKSFTASWRASKKLSRPKYSLRQRE